MTKVRFGHDPRSDETRPSTSTGSRGVPGSVVPESVVPDSVVPDSVVPDSVVPDSVAPDSAAARGLAAVKAPDSAAGSARDLENRMPAASR